MIIWMFFTYGQGTDEPYHVENFINNSGIYYEQGRIHPIDTY